MAWSDTVPGTVKGHDKTSDYDLVFDNQQRVADEFAQQHKWTTTGATDGKHNGITVRKFSGSFSIASTGVNITNVLTRAESTSGGLWLVYLDYVDDLNRTGFHEILLDETVKAMTNAGIGGVNTITVYGHWGQAENYTTVVSSPDPPRWEWFYDSPNYNLEVDLKVNTGPNPAAAGKYRVAVVRLSNYQV